MRKFVIFFIKNGFSINVIKRTVVRKIKRFKEPVVFGHFLCPIYLELPWLGRNSQILADRVSAYITSSFTTIKVRVVFDTRSVLPYFIRDGQYFYTIIL